MHPVEQTLGFRVNQLRKQVETLGPNGEVLQVRPATEHEISLWSEVMENYAARQAAITASADVKSLANSNNAYRAMLQKLYDGIKYITHIEVTDDAVEKALQLINTAYNQPQAAEEAEKRRHEYVRMAEAKHFPGDPINSVLAEELQKMQDKAAGRPVRDIPQA